ncbi:hypothetical protein [Bacillus sp. BS98]|uniref:hypothetical protein n=1 Tax=Bacillus sp. BS98 TaxID=2608254 RepID=UPI00122FA5A1|nr:hypothetical protein [Bacillus sp. BS98]QEQ20797.1 hypothetical protein F0362_30130 [Bacillus sp. BS98]
MSEWFFSKDTTLAKVLSFNETVLIAQRLDTKDEVTITLKEGDFEDLRNILDLEEGHFISLNKNNQIVDEDGDVL